MIWDLRAWGLRSGSWDLRALASEWSEWAMSWDLRSESSDQGRSGTWDLRVLASEWSERAMSWDLRSETSDQGRSGIWDLRALASGWWNLNLGKWDLGAEIWDLRESFSIWMIRVQSGSSDRGKALGSEEALVSDGSEWSGSWWDLRAFASESGIRVIEVIEWRWVL